MTGSALQQPPSLPPSQSPLCGGHARRTELTRSLSHLEEMCPWTQLPPHQLTPCPGKGGCEQGPRQACHRSFSLEHLGYVHVCTLTPGLTNITWGLRVCCLCCFFKARKSEAMEYRTETPAGRQAGRQAGGEAQRTASARAGEMGRGRSQARQTRIKHISSSDQRLAGARVTGSRELDSGGACGLRCPLERAGTVQADDKAWGQSVAG